MGYELQALVGKVQVLQQHSGPFQSVRVVSLNQGIGMILLTDEFYEELGGDGEFDAVGLGKHRGTASWFQELGPN